MSNPLLPLRPRNRRLLARATAIAALAMGGLALAAAISGSPAIANLLPGGHAVVSSSLLCVLSFCGAQLLSLARRRNWATALSGVALLVSMTVLSQHILRLDRLLGTAAADGSMRCFAAMCGRMSMNVCLAILLLSAGQLAVIWLPSRRSAQLAYLFAMLAGSIGVIGMLSSVLPLDFLYHSLGLVQIEPLAGLVVALLAASLWGRAPRAAHPEPSKDFHLNAVTRGVVVLVATITGLAGFAVTQQRLESVLGDEVSQRLAERADFVALALLDDAQHADLTASSLNLAEELSQAEQSQDQHARQPLYALIRSLMSNGFSAITYTDLEGHPIASLGTPHGEHNQASLQGVPLGRDDGTTELLWDDGYYLAARREVRRNGQPVGYALSEQPVLSLTRLLASASTASASADLMLCSARPANLMCFPSHLHPLPFQPDATRNAVEAALVPHAHFEPTGLERVISPDGEPLLTAFHPVSDTGLEMVMVSDLNDIYAPLRSAFQRVLPLILLVAVAGVLVVRWFVRPLVRQLLVSRQAAEHSEARFRAAAEGGLDALYLLEPIRDRFNQVRDFRFAYSNSQGERLLGVKHADLIDALLSQHLPQMRNSAWFARYLKVLESATPISGNVMIHLPGMRGTWIHQHVAPLGDGLAVTVRDISEAKSTEERLRHAAQTDSLTGLPNRALLMDRLERALLRASRHAGTLALLYLDLDGFKQINDHYGHGAGDAVLVEFSLRLKKALRAEDTVARLGGDEFCGLIENLSDRAEAFRIADSLLLAARMPITTPDHTLRITASIGIAFHESGDLTAEQFLARADSALYRVKRSGRDGYFGEELVLQAEQPAEDAPIS